MVRRHKVEGSEIPKVERRLRKAVIFFSFLNELAILLWENMEVQIFTQEKRSLIYMSVDVVIYTVPLGQLNLKVNLHADSGCTKRLTLRSSDVEMLPLQLTNNFLDILNRKTIKEQSCPRTVWPGNITFAPLF
jgi:hypothetical protein